MENELSNKRTGSVTSSDCVDLTTNGTRPMTEKELEDYKRNDTSGKRKTVDDYGKPFYTYVKDCRIERFFKQKLNNDVDVIAMSWGKLCEKLVHNLLPYKYLFHSNITIDHPRVNGWMGTPDGSIPIYYVLTKNTITGFYEYLDKGIEYIDTVTDVKCPSSRKKFYELIEPLYDFDGFDATPKANVNGNEAMQLIRKTVEGEKYYWQLVSNACILNAKYAELIVFMPYYEDLAEIKLYNNTLKVPFYKVENSKFEELPHILKESGVNNINKIRFEVPAEDKAFLEKRVKEAIRLINE